MKDYYYELGVTPIDEIGTIHKAYMAKSKTIYKKTGEEQKFFFEAWKVISDEDKRKEYDAQPQFQLRKISSRLTAAGAKKKNGERVPFRWGVPLMEILMMPFKKEEESNKVTPEETANIHFTQGVLLAADPNGCEKAKLEFKAVLDLIPDLKEAQYNYAIMCYRLGQYQEAYECFGEYLKNDSKDLMARKMTELLK